MFVKAGEGNVCGGKASKRKKKTEGASCMNIPFAILLPYHSDLIDST